MNDRMFGIPLEEAIKANVIRSNLVPDFAKRAFLYLSSPGKFALYLTNFLENVQTEGLFRISGNTKKMNDFMALLDKGIHVNFAQVGIVR